MAKYWAIPYPEELGSPSSQWASVFGSSSMTVRQDAEGEYYWEYLGGSTTVSVITLLSAGGQDVTGLGDCEVYGHYQITGTSRWDSRQLLKYTGTSFSDSMGRAGGVEDSGSATEVRLTAITSNSDNNEATEAITAFAEGDDLYQRTQSFGNEHKTRHWRNSETEPSVWDLEITSSAGVQASGDVGQYRYWAGEIHIYGIGIGTEGDPAPTGPVDPGGEVNVDLASEPVTAIDNTLQPSSGASATLNAEPVSAEDNPITASTGAIAELQSEPVATTDNPIIAASGASVTLKSDTFTVSDNTVSHSAGASVALAAEPITTQDNTISPSADTTVTLQPESITAQDNAITPAAGASVSVASEAVTVTDNPIQAGAAALYQIQAETVSTTDHVITAYAGASVTIGGDAVAANDNNITPAAGASESLTPESMVVADSPIAVTAGINPYQERVTIQGVFPRRETITGSYNRRVTIQGSYQRRVQL